MAIPLNGGLNLTDGQKRQFSDKLEKLYTQAGGILSPHCRDEVVKGSEKVFRTFIANGALKQKAPNSFTEWSGSEWKARKGGTLNVYEAFRIPREEQFITLVDTQGEYAKQLQELFDTYLDTLVLSAFTMNMYGESIVGQSG